LFGVVIIAMGTKAVWIGYGIGLFLNDLDFGKCKDNVLNYCSL